MSDASGAARQVHPRASGGARILGRTRLFRAGPSPRERGSLQDGLEEIWEPGSIPARAGEPPSVLIGGATPRVHPRASGGAEHADRTPALLGGPSPRERGSRRLGGRRPAGVGSIPARAGEPVATMSEPRSVRVHPRASGGAFGTGAGAYDPRGPSPRERGSHAPCLDAPEVEGSIPARAGEPGSASAPASASGVHPRASGGAW